LLSAFPAADPVGLFPSGGGLLYLDFLRGVIRNLDIPGDWGAAIAPGTVPVAGGPAAYVYAQPGQATWTPGQGTLTYTAQSNIGGREGFNTEWAVSLLWGCDGGGNCNRANLIAPAGPSARTVTFPAPPIAGTLEIWVHAWTFAGLQVTDWKTYPSVNTAACTCPGNRNAVTPASIGWNGGGAAPVDPVGGGGGGGAAAGGGGGTVGAITLQAFPAPGTLDAISGTVGGLANPAGYKVAMYLSVQDGQWYIKPLQNAATQLSGAGAFTVSHPAALHADPATLVRRALLVGRQVLCSLEQTPSAVRAAAAF
jgi:hypothetical protein